MPFGYCTLRGLKLMVEARPFTQLARAEQKTPLDFILLVESGTEGNEFVLARSNFQNLIAHNGAFKPNGIRVGCASRKNKDREKKKKIMLYQHDFNEAVIQLNNVSLAP